MCGLVNELKEWFYLQRVPPFLGVQSFRGFLGDPVKDTHLSVEMLDSLYFMLMQRLKGSLPSKGVCEILLSLFLRCEDREINLDRY